MKTQCRLVLPVLLLTTMSLVAHAWLSGSKSAGRCQTRARSSRRFILSAAGAVTDDTASTAAVTAHIVSSSQTVAVVGSGAIGCYYGARLWEAGHDVKFLMRSDLKACRTNGMNVTSILGDIVIPPEQLQAYSSTSEIGEVDWILVCLKTTSFDSIPELIQPLVDSQRTRVVLIMNGLELEESLTRVMPNGTSFCRALYGGMAFICSNRLGPGHVDHSFAGLLAAGRQFGSDNDDNATADQEAFEQLWAPSKVEVSYEPILLRGRWKKMLWNLSFNGISVAMGGITVDQIVQNPSLRQLATNIMAETVAIANADMKARLIGHDWEPFTKADMDYMIDLSDNMDFAYQTSTMLDLTNRKAMEVKFLFQTPLERARALGVAAPCLATIVAQIEGFQSMYGLY